jgi:hypothetical protein
MEGDLGGEETLVEAEGTWLLAFLVEVLVKLV